MSKLAMSLWRVFCMYYYYNLLRGYSRDYTGNIMCHFVRHIAIPVILEVIFIVSCFILPRHLYIYSNMAFFVALLGYIITTKSVSIYQWYHALAGE